MQNDTPVEQWRQIITERKGTLFQDALIYSLAQSVGFLRFTTSNGPDWPHPRWGYDKNVFGATRIYRGRYQIRRSLHGFAIILASGDFMPAHAARLSDLAEAVFNKYRIEPGRAKWNFSEEQARLDLGREPELAAALYKVEKALLDKGVLPGPLLLAAMREQGAAPRHLNRAAKRAQWEISHAALTERVKGLEDAALTRLEELSADLALLSERLNKLETLCQTTSNS